VQAVRKSKEAFKLQEDAQYGSSPFKPKDKVRLAHSCAAYNMCALVLPLTMDTRQLQVQYACAF
jgi:hypothetical protein